jgi:hypothetical protein
MHKSRLNGEIISEQWIGDNVEESDHSLTEGAMLEFAWRKSNIRKHLSQGIWSPGRYLSKEPPNSVVGIVTDYGLDDRGVGVRVPVKSRILSSHVVQTDSGAHQPPIQQVPGALSVEVKRQEREADHSSPASAEFKKMWIYTSTPP